MLESAKVLRKIAASVRFVEKAQCYELSVVDEDGVRVVVEAGKNYDKAMNQELAMNNIIKCLKKAGDSCFDIKDVMVEVEVYPFIPVSELNELRRGLLKNSKKNALPLMKLKNQKVFLSALILRGSCFMMRIL